MPRGRERRRRVHTHGQALVEFALVFPLVLAALLATIAGLLYATEVASVIGATQVASRIAAGVSDPGTGTSALDEVALRLPSLLQPGLPGTSVSYYTGASCPSPDTVTAPGRLAVCTQYAPGVVTATRVVVVRIYGHLPALIPGFPAFPVDEQAVLHPMTFTR